MGKIEVTCIECKQKMVGGILEHLESCSATKLNPPRITDYIRPPALVMKFESKKAQAEWLRNLKTGGSEHLALRKLANNKKEGS